MIKYGEKKLSIVVALAMVFSLFFLWAISNNLLPTMIKQIMKTCQLNTFQASFTETSYWLAYFIFPIPIAIFMKQFSYKSGVIFGLLLSAFGGFMFIPATLAQSYWVYLMVFFIIAAGMCFLETAANPYVTVLGDPSRSVRRLNMAQAFNGLGAFVAAMFLSKMVLSGDVYTPETLPTNYVGGWEGYITAETNNMKLPYIILASILLIIAIVFIFTKLPKIEEEENDSTHGKLISFAVLKRAHLRNGVIAQFFYNGGQTAINSMFLIYCCLYNGMTEEKATTLFGIYMLSFLLGRWIGTMLMAKFRPQNMLVVYGIANVVLCCIIAIFGGMVGVYAMIGVSFFMSIMYPTQFSLAIDGLKEDTKSGSAFLVMAIVGNAILPPATAYILHNFKEIYHVAYFIPMVCFAVCAWYGWKGYKISK